jgi:hypothetical protein
VSNDADQPINIDVTVENWLNAGANSIKNPSAWLTIEERAFRLEPNSKREISYSVKMPEGLAGEAAAMVFFASTSVEGPQSMFVPRLGVIIYLIQKGSEIVDATIENIKVRAVSSEKGDRRSRKLRVTFKVDTIVKNTGNVHLRPKGEVVIHNLRGKQLYKEEIPYGWVVQQKKENLCSAVLRDMRLRPGRYKASVSLTFGSLYEQEKQISHEVTFSLDRRGRIRMK